MIMEIEKNDHCFGPLFKWISENGWKDLELLCTLDKSLNNLCADIKGNENIWKTWYDKDTPETEPIPLDYSVSTV